jgi:hypothetical protein
MPRDRQPNGFTPGAPLDQYQSRLMREAGFESGYPLFSIPNHSAADDLQLIIHALTFPRLGEYGGPVSQRRPTIGMGTLVPKDPKDSGYPEIRSTPMAVTEIRRSWQKPGLPYWYLKGNLVRDSDQRWSIGRKRVNGCEIHLLLEDYEAYIQFVPIGAGGQLPRVTSEDDWRWGDLSSPTLPPKPVE